MSREHLRAALRAREQLLATFLMIPRVEMIEMLALAGFDAVLFDLEHGPMSARDLPMLAAAAKGAGIHSIARLAEGSEPTIANTLDAGVDGVLVPHVGSAAEARAVVRAGRFPPVGDRSLNPYVRGTDYGLDEGGVRDLANERVAVMAMLEGQDALASLDEISEVEDLDALFVGPVDLSASLGFPGQPEHPEVVEAVGKLFVRFGEVGVAGGIYAPTAQAARRWFDAGANLVAASTDSAMALRAFAAMAAAIRDGA